MKKAIAVTELVIILLAAVSGIGLMFFMKSGASKAGCLEDVSICKNTFLLYQRWRSLGWAGIAPRLDCVAVSPPNCEQKEIKTDKSTEAMYIIAENLRYCWDKTLGKENTMGEDFAKRLNIAADDVDFCLVCSEFKTNVDISADEWNAYLDAKSPPGSQSTYSNLIQPSETTLKWSDKAKPLNYRNIGFTKGLKYYVVSVSAEDSKGDKKVYVYIDSSVDCGKKDPQIHYQLK